MGWAAWPEWLPRALAPDVMLSALPCNIRGAALLHCTVSRRALFQRALAASLACSDALRHTSSFCLTAAPTVAYRLIARGCRGSICTLITTEHRWMT